MDKKSRDLLTHRASDELGKFSVYMRFYPPTGLNGEASEELTVDILDSITAECFKRGADMIGHIKSFMNSEDGVSISASLIDPDIGVSVQNRFDGHILTRGEFTIHVIVHGMWDPQVRETSLFVIDTVMKKRGIEHEIINDYFEKEKRVQD